jgi:hypothetical protein
MQDSDLAGLISAKFTPKYAILRVNMKFSVLHLASCPKSVILSCNKKHETETRVFRFPPGIRDTFLF